VREKYCWLVADKPSEQDEERAIFLVELKSALSFYWRTCKNLPIIGISAYCSSRNFHPLYYLRGHIWNVLNQFRLAIYIICKIAMQ
jgi:hypothetical protein